MSRYSVVGHVSASKWLGYFEANSPEEAVEMALDSQDAHVSVCHQCADEISDPEIEDATAELDEELAAMPAADGEREP